MKGSSTVDVVDETEIEQFERDSRLLRVSRSLTLLHRTLFQHGTPQYPCDRALGFLFSTSSSRDEKIEDFLNDIVISRFERSNQSRFEIFESLGAVGSIEEGWKVRRRVRIAVDQSAVSEGS